MTAIVQAFETPLDTAASPPPPRQLLGVRIDAILEVVAFLAVALVLDRFLGAGDRFAEMSPHPFWIAVLLASTYYGTAEGLAAAVLCAAALLAGNLPQQAFNEDLYGWLLRVNTELSLWCLAAVVLGGIQRSRRRVIATMRAELEKTQAQALAITHAYEQQQVIKEGLEARVAGHVGTVYSMYKASRAIERLRVGEVMVGVAELVRAVIAPRKFSLFLLNGASLEAAVSEGWLPQDRYAREFDSSSPLFEAIVVQRRLLVFAEPLHGAVLHDEGLLAGALISEETNEIVGMLKIEDLAFRDLHPTTVENFRVLCEWIGTAFANAQRVEDLQEASIQPPARVLTG